MTSTTAMAWCGVLAAVLAACGHGAGQLASDAPVPQVPVTQAPAEDHKDAGPAAQVSAEPKPDKAPQEESVDMPDEAEAEPESPSSEDEEGFVQGSMAVALTGGDGFMLGKPRSGVLEGGRLLRPTVSWPQAPVLHGDADAGAVHKALMGAQSLGSCGIHLVDEVRQDAIEVRIELTILSDGTVMGAWADDEAVEPFIAECIETALSEVRFAPPNAGDVDVEAVVVFEEPVQ